MDRHAIFVDAGYFYAAGTQAAFGLALSRKLVSIVSPENLIKDLAAAAATPVDAKPILRVYWYDAMPGPRLSLEQTAIALLPAVKLRLGALNSAGEQKGVDSLIVTDLIELARNGAISDAVLVSGDEDLRIAVLLAQSFGVKVHILAAGNPRQNVSSSLRMEADSVSALNGDWFNKHFVRSSDNSAMPVASLPSQIGNGSRICLPGKLPDRRCRKNLCGINGIRVNRANREIARALQFPTKCAARIRPKTDCESIGHSVRPQIHRR